MLEVHSVSAEDLRQVQSGLVGRTPLEQAEPWEGFAAVMGSPLRFRLLISEDGKPLAFVSLYSHELRGAKFLWARRGPVWLKQPPPEREESALLAIKRYVTAEDPEIVFIRLHSWYVHPFLRTPIRVLGYDRTALINGARGNRQAALDAMPSAGRKLVRRSQTLFGEAGGVIAEETGLTQEEFHEYYKLLEETALRDCFTPHEENYYWQLLVQLGPEHARLFGARIDGDLVCWDLVIAYRKNVGAFFGASSDSSRQTKATVLLDFEVACMLAEEGMCDLDLMGVHSPMVPSLYSVGRYKLQFVQNYTNVPGLWEFPLRPNIYGTLCGALKVRATWRSVSSRLRLVLDRQGGPTAPESLTLGEK